MWHRFAIDVQYRARQYRDREGAVYFDPKVLMRRSSSRRAGNGPHCLYSNNVEKSHFMLDELLLTC